MVKIFKSRIILWLWFNLNNVFESGIPRKEQSFVSRLKFEEPRIFFEYSNAAILASCLVLYSSQRCPWYLSISDSFKSGIVN